MSTTQTVLAVLAIVLGGGAFGTLAGKLFPQRESASKKRSDRVSELEQGRADDRSEIAEMREENTKLREDVKNDMRILTDYVHDLREHIAQGKPPPPPDWPPGLRM